MPWFPDIFPNLDCKEGNFQIPICADGSAYRRFEKFSHIPNCFLFLNDRRFFIKKVSIMLSHNIARSNAIDFKHINPKLPKMKDQKKAQGKQKGD